LALYLTAANFAAAAVCVFAPASKDKTVMVWDTRAPGTPVATLGVRAGDARTTHTGEGI
jgi:hypothetical protein